VEVLEDKHLYRSFTCAQCGYTFKAPVYCGNRFCEICGQNRRRRIRSKLKAITDNVKYGGGFSIKHLVLTIPNVENIHDAAKTLQVSFRRLRQHSLWQNKVRGGAWTIEVQGRPGRWHVHLHALLESKYIPHSVLRSHWRKVSPGRIVYIKPISAKTGINYLISYVSKCDAPVEHHLHISDQLKGIRVFQPFGSWHGICIDVEKIRYQCPDCGYTGFYWNPDECPWEQYGRDPPLNSLGYKIKRQVVARHGVCVHPVTKQIFR
jgi:predicted nucleic-acid-binding Zn-ribbon protein